MYNLTNKIFSKTPYLTLLYKWVSSVPTPSYLPAKTGRHERSGHCPTAFLKPKRVVATFQHSFCPTWDQGAPRVTAFSHSLAKVCKCEWLQIPSPHHPTLLPPGWKKWVGAAFSHPQPKARVHTDKAFSSHTAKALGHTQSVQGTPWLFELDGQEGGYNWAPQDHNNLKESSW